MKNEEKQDGQIPRKYFWLRLAKHLERETFRVFTESCVASFSVWMNEIVGDRIESHIFIIRDSN